MAHVNVLCLYEHRQGLAGAKERRVSLCQRVHWKPATSENPNRGAAAMNAGMVVYFLHNYHHGSTYELFLEHSSIVEDQALSDTFTFLNVPNQSCQKVGNRQADSLVSVEF